MNHDFNTVKVWIEQTRNPSYIAPIEPERLGKIAFHYGIQIESWWRGNVVNGWEAAASAAFDSIGNSDGAMAFAESLP